jgi:hypothetical protein
MNAQVARAMIDSLNEQQPRTAGPPGPAGPVGPSGRYPQT